jgi:hypothetical protein
MTDILKTDGSNHMVVHFSEESWAEKKKKKTSDRL